MRDRILAIDAGGTATKVALFDAAGIELAVHGEPLKPIILSPGFNERDPEVVWSAICRSVKHVLAATGCDPRDIAAVGLTAYGNGLLLVDGAGLPVRNAILSSDQRAASIVAEWRKEGLEAGQFGLTNQRLFAGKALPLLKWVAENEPETLGRARHALSFKDFLRLRMVGAPRIEVSDASSSGFLDHSGRTFTPRVLEHFGLAQHKDLFPETIEPLEIAGALTEKSARELGLQSGTPVSAGYADGPAMLLAQGVVDQSLLNVVSGTWGLNQLITEKPITDGSILGCTLGPRPGEYILIDGGVTSASNFEWFVGKIRPGGAPAMSYEWYNDAVSGLGLGEDPIYYLPFVNGRLDEPRARGTFIGLSSWHGLPHMTRAVYEGVAMEHRHHVEKLLQGRKTPSSVRIAGGAARSQPWLEIFAATLRLPIERSRATELGALGAAIIAAVGVGIHSDLETAVGHMSAVSSTIQPKVAHVDEMDRRYAVYRDLREHLDLIWNKF